MLPVAVDVAHSRSNSPRGLDVQDAMAETGLRLVNAPHAHRVAHDKWACAQRLVRCGVAAIPTMLVSGAASAGRVLEVLDGGAGLVVKPRWGSGGNGVRRCRTAGELSSLLAEAGVRRIEVIAQPYRHTGGRDIRALVIGGECVAVGERRAPAGEWRTNIARGATFRRMAIEADIAELAVAAAGACELDIAGVDISTVPEPAVIEVNSNPGVISFGTEIIDAVVAHIAAVAPIGLR